MKWVGGPGKNGVGIVVREGLTLSVRDSHNELAYIVVRVHGFAEPIDIVGFWAMDDHRIQQSTLSMIEEIRKLGTLPARTVIAGNFNNNAYPQWKYGFNNVKTVLTESLGMSSAYHVFTSENFGSELLATIYRKPKQFHTDYVWVPREWKDRVTNVQVPGYEEHKISEHRPVIVDLSGI
jgi:hypothetical protein